MPRGQYVQFRHRALQIVPEILLQGLGARRGHLRVADIGPAEGAARRCVDVLQRPPDNHEALVPDNRHVPQWTHNAAAT